MGVRGGGRRENWCDEKGGNSTVEVEGRIEVVLESDASREQEAWRPFVWSRSRGLE